MPLHAVPNKRTRLVLSVGQVVPGWTLVFSPQGCKACLSALPSCGTPKAPWNGAGSYGMANQSADVQAREGNQKWPDPHLGGLLPSAPLLVHYELVCLPPSPAGGCCACP